MMNANHFENFSWHDNAVHGLRLVEGDDGGNGDFLLDIDFIVEWMSPEGECDAFAFRVAPADLVFHEVSDLIVSLDFVSSSAALQPLIIHEIRREKFTYPNGSQTFSWAIEMNWPGKSFITFRASGFTQNLRNEPIVSGAQYLSPSRRAL